jgi:threonine dehydrogenase-like Zn-dependent dehydrogenase
VQAAAWHLNGDTPETIITHRMPLAEAAEGYRIFDEKEQDCRKVVLRPN